MIGVVLLNSVVHVTGGVPVTGSVPMTNVQKTNKQQQRSPAQVEAHTQAHSLTVTISREAIFRVLAFRSGVSTKIKNAHRTPN